MLHITPLVLHQLSQAAISSGAEECCGFLFGLEHDNYRIITSIMEADNIATDRKRNFRICSQTYLCAERTACENGLQLLGVYHSHPNCKAIPSESDRRSALPNLSYLILSVAEGNVNDIRSWNLNSNFKFDEEILSFIDINHGIHGYCNYPNTAA